MDCNVVLFQDRRCIENDHHLFDWDLVGQKAKKCHNMYATFSTSNWPIAVHVVDPPDHGRVGDH